ncbi:MAG: reverse transcriptase domain-containing protein [Roseimicrobium sp.]
MESRLRRMCNHNEPDDQALLEAARKATGAQCRDCTEGHVAVKQRRKKLGRKVAAIVEEERKKAAEQETKARARELAKGKGFSRYSAKIQASGKTTALERADGSVTLDPEEIKGLTRQFYHDLVGVAQSCLRAQDGPWNEYDQERDVIAMRETVTIEDINDYASTCKLNKATDILGINGAVLWYLPTEARHILARIMEAILTLEYVPDRWARTRIILLYKKGAATSLQNYRPVSIVNYWLKVLDGMLLRRVALPLEVSGRLNRMQWAGRPETGCLEALGLLDQALDHAARHARDRHYIYMAMFDAYKAYDTVPQEVMFDRVARIGFPAWARALRTIYSRLSIVVATPAGFTSPIAVRQGIAQGMQSSPLAFIVFMNPLVALLAARQHGYKVKVFGGHRDIRADQWPVANVTVAAIVDDVLAVSDSQQELQCTVTLYSAFGDHNNQRMSMEKSQFATSDPQGGRIWVRRSRLCPPERGDGIGLVEKPLLGPKDKWRYLGIERTIESRAEGTPEMIEGKLYTVLSHLTRKPTAAPLVTAVYHAMVESTFTYVAPWTSFRKTQLR